MSGFKKRVREQTGSTNAAPQKGTYIAASSTLEGQFNFGGPTIIAGQLNGSIHATDLLVIDEGAIVEADITGAVVILKGQVRGALIASEALELSATADFEGNVSAPTLKVAEGAQFRASMDISRTPAEGRAPLQTPMQEPAQAASTPPPAPATRQATTIATPVAANTPVIGAYKTPKILGAKS